MTPMLLDINGPEFLLLLVIAVVLFGPERLPDLARKAARVVQYVRTIAGTAQEQLTKELGPGFEDVDMRDLNPKTFIQKHLLDDVDPIVADVKAEIKGVTASVSDEPDDVADAINGVKGEEPETVGAAAGQARVLPPFDPDATGASPARCRDGRRRVLSARPEPAPADGPAGCDRAGPAPWPGRRAPSPRAARARC